MSYYSPRSPGSTPTYDYDLSRMSSATPTPSPRGAWFEAQTPRRPATRAGTHSRGHSYSQQSTFSPRPPRDSPRYTSTGEYATVDVSYQDSFSRRPSVSSHRPSKRDRRHSQTYVRSSTPYGESDEDIFEVFEELGCAYKPPKPAHSRSRSHKHSHYLPDYDRVWYTTNLGYYSQEVPTYYSDARVHSRDTSYDMPRPIAQPRPPTSHHVRRSSASVPQRSQTVRPVAHQVPRQAPSFKPAGPRAATDEDARIHKIPAGYSLKNWDPSEPPILLLGSVFDANSLGKWIYDWTVASVGSRQPIAEMAGDLWLLLLELSEKSQQADRLAGQIRSKEKRALVAEYLDGSDRLFDTLRSLLKRCEGAMLRPSKQKQEATLQKNAGREFVDTLFGRDRELQKTEKFMHKVRTWGMRYDANVAPILAKPTA